MRSINEMIDRLVRNVPNMPKFSFIQYFGYPGKGPHTVENLQAIARSRLETKTDEGAFLLDISTIYDDAEGNDELTDK